MATETVYRWQRWFAGAITAGAWIYILIHVNPTQHGGN